MSDEQKNRDSWNDDAVTNYPPFEKQHLPKVIRDLALAIAFFLMMYGFWHLIGLVP